MKTGIQDSEALESVGFETTHEALSDIPAEHRVLMFLVTKNEREAYDLQGLRELPHRRRGYLSDINGSQLNSLDVVLLLAASKKKRCSAEQENRHSDSPF